MLGADLSFGIIELVEKAASGKSEKPVRKIKPPRGSVKGLVER